MLDDYQSVVFQARLAGVNPKEKFLCLCTSTDWFVNAEYTMCKYCPVRFSIFLCRKWRKNEPVCGISAVQKTFSSDIIDGWCLQIQFQSKIVLRLLKCFPQSVLAMNDGFAVFFLPCVKWVSTSLTPAAHLWPFLLLCMMKAVKGHAVAASPQHNYSVNQYHNITLFEWRDVFFQLLFKINRMGMLSYYLSTSFRKIQWDLSFMFCTT